MAKGFKKPKVFVAMSGGVDSSVAAALLKKQGPAPEQARYGVNFDVTGVFMRLFDGADSAGAQKIAEKLAVSFKVFDFKREFKKKVIDYFLRGYERGITPNPCIVCNKEIKFGLFLKRALKEGADYIATGHYIRNLTFSAGAEKVKFKLIKAKDKEKDQSYFLWTLTQEQISKVLFPTGEYTKKEVREMAKKLGISDLIKGESEDICFLEGADLCGYLKTRINTDKGRILTADGKIIGENNGLAFYTIGQRKGIKIASEKPFYVVKKDAKNNALIVSQNPKDLLSKSLIVKDVNWIFGKQPHLPLRVKAKIRYRHQPALAIIQYLKSNIYHLIFDKPQRAITPGQSVVFYRKEELLGGGIIAEITKT